MKTSENASNQAIHRQSPQRRQVTAIASLLILGILSGCATSPSGSQSMIDETANFDDYKTFGWMIEASPEYPLPIVETKIRDAIAAEMQSKGYNQAVDASSADLLIDYDAAREETVKSRPFRIGIGIGSYGSHGGASIGTSTSGYKEIDEGSLIIHFVDTVRSAEVWRSGVSRELGKGAVDSDVIVSVVAEVLQDFPARPANQ